MKHLNHNSTTTEQRVAQLTSGPVLRTWHGCIERVKCLGLKGRWLLCGHFDCDPEELHDVLWQHQKEKGVSQDGNEEPRNRNGRGD